VCGRDRGGAIASVGGCAILAGMTRLVVAALAVIAALAGACAGPAATTRDRGGGTDPVMVDPWAAAPADEPPSAVATRALADRACPKVAAPYFYRIEKDGKASYILGTRHLGVSLDKMPASVVGAIRGATVAVFEVAPGDDAERPAPGGPPLPERLGPALWGRYRRLVGRANARVVERGAPSDAIITMIALYEHKLAALDVELQQVAARAKIPTQGLESAAFQQRLIGELLDLRMLRAAIAGTPDRAALERDATEDLREYCVGTDETPGVDGRERAQLRAAGYSEAEIDRLDQRLIFERNAAWIPQLERILDGGGAFIAVGADHLTGPRGVIALLAARGYRATRVAP
jgi:uncharacterized protein YbaP (TraB family)